MKLLLAVSRYPWPPWRGDQLRTVQMLDYLSGEHEVTLVAPEPRPGDEPPPSYLRGRFHLETYRQSRGWACLVGLLLAVARWLPLQSGLYYHPDLSRTLRRLAPKADLGILQLVRLAIHRRDFGDTPLLVDLIDSLSLNFSWRSHLDRSWLRPIFRLEARLLAIWEHRLLGEAAGGILICDRDRLALARRRRLPPEVASRLSVVPLSVRVRRPGGLHPEQAEEGGLHPSADGGPTIMITGNLGYFVNLDAIRWWLHHVWGGLRHCHPGVRLVVAGDRPGPRLRRMLARAGAELIESPRNLRSILARATVALAPMRGGSGLPIKILEAWSVGVPVVASPWAAAGTAGRAGEDFLVAETPEDWIDALCGLLADVEARRRLVRGGYACLVREYSRRHVQGSWLEVVDAAAAAGEVGLSLGAAPAPEPLPD